MIVEITKDHERGHRKYKKGQKLRVSSELGQSWIKEKIAKSTDSKAFEKKEEERIKKVEKQIEE